MDEKITVKPDTIYLPDLLDEVKRGQYKIPKFQRDFVWTPNQMVELFDSLLKGYPMGSLLFWKTDDEFHCKENIGIFTLSNNTKNFSYVLDGFQRIATLFNSLMSPQDFDEKSIDKEKEKDFLICFDIRNNTFIHAKARKAKSIFSVPLYEIYDDKLLFYFLRKLDNENIAQTDKETYAENARNLNYVLHKYRLPFVEIRGGDIKNATTIFSRINSKGTEISTDFMISALTYNKDSGFTFSDEISEFLDELNNCNFNEVDRNTILNCIVTCATDNFFYDVNIEKQIETKNFDLEAETKKAFVCIKNAIEFLYQIGSINNRFMPYFIQLIFISYFFKINPNPNTKQRKN